LEPGFEEVNVLTLKEVYMAIDPTYWRGTWLDCDLCDPSKSAISAIFIAVILAALLGHSIYRLWGWASAKRADIKARKNTNA
jgi:hypothetical protein